MNDKDTNKLRRIYLGEDEEPPPTPALSKANFSEICFSFIMSTASARPARSDLTIV